jgi:hypothetical protein
MFLLLYTLCFKFWAYWLTAGAQGFTSKKGNPQKKKVCIQKKGSLKNFPHSHSWIIYFVYT